MTRNPIDIANRGGPRLSALLRSRVNNPACEQPGSLMGVRRFLADLLPEDFKEAEQLHHFDVSESPLDELDALIEEFGATALALDFVQASVSEPLSRVTLLAGLGARLVGDGVLEEDEDDSLLPEIDALIEHAGGDSLAEEFLRDE